jgi:hypothetical protein
MIDTNAPSYVCALRMKAGELMGVRDLAPDVANKIIPRFIVPPQSERTDELQPRLIAGDRFPDISTSLAGHWRNRRALIEATYLIDEFGRDRMGLWLPKMFESARKASAEPIPLVAIDDLLRDDSLVYRTCIDPSASIKFGIVFSSGSLGDSDIADRALNVLGKIGIAPRDCVVIADFHDADFTNPDLVAPVIAGVLELLQTAAPWRHVIFQGTNFPGRNPAASGCHVLVPRNEWIAWQQAVHFDRETADHMIFGDYAADCAKIAFGGSASAPAIRHYRYSTPNSWLVQRGSDNGSHAVIMQTVCEEILASGYFAGREFSLADEYIYRSAKRAGGPGTAKEWRAVNTTHHITQVVSDIGRIRGFEIKRRVRQSLDDQMSFSL